MSYGSLVVNFHFISITANYYKRVTEPNYIKGYRISNALGSLYDFLMELIFTDHLKSGASMLLLSLTLYRTRHAQLDSALMRRQFMKNVYSKHTTQSSNISHAASPIVFNYNACSVDVELFLWFFSLYLIQILLIFILFNSKFLFILILYNIKFLF